MTSPTEEAMKRVEADFQGAVLKASAPTAYPDFVYDRGGLDRWREMSAKGDGHDMASANKNTVQRFVQTIDTLERALRNTLQALREKTEECERLGKLVYVPGVTKCAKCGLRLISSTLNASNGSVCANNEPQACPNGCGPMWKVTERDAGNEVCDRLDKAASENNELRLAMLGGEDAPGYAASLPLAEVIRAHKGWTDERLARAEAAEARYTALAGKVEGLVEALEFYADPGAYHAMMILADPPCGEFMDDFDNEHGDLDYNRPMPGKRARRALSTHLAAVEAEDSDVAPGAKSARPQPGQGVATTPSGWMLVPIVPTVEMIIAGTEEWLCIRAQEDRAEIIWDEMLAASPFGRHGTSSDGAE